MIPLILPQDSFPNPRYAIENQDGLVCVTESLSPALLLKAYPQGIFPWYNDEHFFYWFSIAPRAVLLPEQLKLSRSLKKSIQNKSYRVSVNQQFAEVIAQCAATPRPHQHGTWIAPTFQAAYTQLHQMGHAHSFEFYNENNKLTGGLYGVQIGQIFFGESMFAHESDASKIAFAHAVPFLAKCGVQLIDCQQDTEHLRRFGSQLMAFNDFQAALKNGTNTRLNQPIIAQTIFQAA